MAHNSLLAAVLLIMVSMVVAPQIQAEDVFDTTESAKHMEKGFAHLKARNYDAAIREFEESAEINPEAESFYYLGYAYYAKNRIDKGQSREKSLENFEKAYEIDPNFTPSRYRTADAPETAAQAQSRSATGAAPHHEEPKTPAAEQPNP